jgi:ribosomal protein S12 methylthiotransferase accessory factor
LEKYTVRTDQPVDLGGADEAPGPFELFLVSLATCAGFYVLGFCQSRAIPTDGVKLIQHSLFDPATHQLREVDVEIVLPPTFPEKYRDAVVRAAEACKVRKTLASPPAIRVHVATAGTANPGAGASRSNAA